MLSYRIGRELVSRGYRDATDVVHSFGRGVLDSDLFLQIGAESVLVTVDDDMLREHETDIQRRAPTLSLIDMRARPVELTPSEYHREVIHRHVHRMVEQERGSIYAYRRGRRRRISS
jgi:hypothetical protein